MKGKIKFLLLKTVQDNNILPITSVCGMSCRFCSHRNNPSEVETYSFGHLKLELIKELVDYLPPEGPVIIGESATKIIEGDPFTHPNFKYILELIREKYPTKTIRITTHGSLLTGEEIDLLKRIKPVEINISLNCADPEERVFLMGDKSPERVFQVLKELKKNEITFHGSIVALPWFMGIDSIKKTIEFLIKNNSRSVRVFIPGFSRFKSGEFKVSFKKDYIILKKLIKGFQYQAIPVLLEPPIMNDLKARIIGLIPDSPVTNTILQIGDIIDRINGRKVMSRTEAFYMAEKHTNPELEILRNNKFYKVVLPKMKGEKPGFIVNYDLSYSTIETFRNKLDSAMEQPTGRIAVVTSVLARELIKAFLDELRINPEQVKLIVVENSYFGGSIVCAGLLTVRDIIQTLESSKDKFDLIILPGIIFDIFGNDLTGTSYRILEDKLKTKVELI